MNMKQITNKFFIVLMSVVLISAITGTSMAQEEATTQETTQEKNWEDSAELSYVQTGGNTDILTFSGNNLVKYKFSENWKGSWKVGLLYGKTDGVKNAERYNSDLRMDYNVSDVLYYYAKGGWLKDEFAGIRRRLYLGPGAGYNLLTGDRNFLSVEAGLNYAKEKYTDNTDENFMEGRFQGKYEYVFNKKTKFDQDIEYLHNFKDSGKFRINTLTGLTTRLTDMFSLKVSYEMNFQNEPNPDTLKKTDTTFSVALVVNF